MLGRLFRAMFSRNQRVRMRGWSKWLLVLVLPLGGLYFEAWLNTRTLRNDYGLSRINQQIRILQTDVEQAKIEEAKYAAADRFKETATDLGLVQPEPNQIEVVYYADQKDDGETQESAPYVVARRGTKK
jgi:hypothetical protein